MLRREFIAGLGIVAAWPLAVRAQQSSTMRRIGILIPQEESDAQAQAAVAAFSQVLQSLGWTDGGTAQFRVRWAGDELNRLKGFAKELVAWQPDVILSRTTLATATLLQESRTVPIVFVNVSDPIGPGFAASMAHPGGNATSFTNVEQSVGGKWVDVLREADATITRIAVLFDPKAAPERGAFYLRLIEAAARSVGVETVAMPIENVAAIESSFVALRGADHVGIVVQPDITTTANRTQIIALAAKYRLPAVYPFSFFTAEGGLASYGIDVIDGYKRAAGYVDRILRGEKPGDLPVQAPIKFELSVNLKTAKALGLQLPAMLLGRADQVVE
jgi:putative ABC transport system substrate-binding protein